MKNAFCKFCGQLSANEYPEDISEAELIERGTMDCSCYEAQQYQKEKPKPKKQSLSLKRYAERLIRTAIWQRATATYCRYLKVPLTL